MIDTYAMPVALDFRLSFGGQTSRLVVDSRPLPRLHALGDPAIGSIFFTVGVESLVDRAIDIVQSIRADNAASSKRATGMKRTGIPA